MTRKLEQPDCIVPRIYQNTEGVKNIKRLNVDDDGLPTWPLVTSTFDEASKNTVRTFYIEPNDLV